VVAPEDALNIVMRGADKLRHEICQRLLLADRRVATRLARHT
jgi:hypothetical protein